MSAAPCSMELLVEARRDGRLDGDGEASVLRHLGTCAPCAALDDDLERIRAAVRVTPPSPLEHRRARLRLLQAALVPPRPVRGARPALGIAMALLLAAAAVVAVFGAAAPSHPSALSARLPRNRLALSARTETWIDPVGAAVFGRSRTAGLETVTLDDGSLALAVRHLGEHERFVVRTSDGEVEVRGTIFRVEARAAHLVGVVVAEGRVEVRFGGVTRLVAAGESWSPPAEAPSRAPAEPATTAVATPAETRLAVPPPAEARAVPSADLPPADRAESPPKPERATAFADGVALVERGEYGSGAESLRRFATDHPEDARAEDAWLLAITAAQRAGNRDRIRDLAREYLARYPNGYRRAAVLSILASQGEATRPGATTGPGARQHRF